MDDREAKLKKLYQDSTELGDHELAAKALNAIKEMRTAQPEVAPKKLEEPSYSGPHFASPESELSNGGNATTNLAAGGIRGAGTIGNVLTTGAQKITGTESAPVNGVTPYEQRKLDMDAALKSMGANPESIAYQIGKTGTEIAGTLPVGGAVGGALGKVAPAARPLAEMIKSGGFGEAPIAGTGIGNFASNTALRAAGGATSAAATNALITPENTGTATVIGGVMPSAVKGIAVPVGRTISAISGNVLKPAEEIGGEKAANYIKEHLTRSNLMPEKAAEEVRQGGKDFLLADVSPTFQSLMGVVGRKSPEVAGKVYPQLEARGAGSAGRAKSTLEQAFGTEGQTSKKAIENLHSDVKPIISEYYKKAASEMAAPIPALEEMMSEGAPIGDIQKEVAKRMQIKQAGGQETTPFDQINTTKQIMDDKINTLFRTGANSEARDWLQLKNNFLNVADENIPSFKQARNLFAGKMQLEEAAKNGEDYLKLSSSDAEDVAKGLGDSEKAMYLLGVKKDVMNKIDNTSTGADEYRKIFGKNGSLDKMKFLFPNEKDFNAVKNNMQKEATFRRTKSQFEGSQTAANLEKDESMGLQDLSALGIAKKAAFGVTKSKNEEADRIAYQKTGELLSKKGLTIGDLNEFLSKGSKSKDKKSITDLIKNKSELTATISQLSAQKQGKK